MSEQGNRRGPAAGAPKLTVIDASSESLEDLKDRLRSECASGNPCMVTLEESEIDGFEADLTANPLLDFVIKPVSERALSMRLNRLADTASAIADREYELENVRAELDRLAYYDRMTDLPNSEFFRRYLAFQIRHAERYGRRLAVLAVDLKSIGRLQSVLDADGIQQLLAESSQRMVRELRSYDVVGQVPQMVPLPDERMLTRIEGDRFLVLLSEFRHLQDVTGIVQRLLKAVAEPMTIDGTAITPTPKVGISLYPEDGTTDDVLIKNAVSALEFSEGHRLGELGFFAESLNDKIADRLVMEARLRNAIDCGAFDVLYQPKVALDSGKVTGFEALVRWDDEELGMVPPDRFVPLAEELEIVSDITRFMVRKVCAQIRDWQGRGISPPVVAVNLSGQDFMQPDFANYVTEQLLVFEVPPRNLEFEITESAVIQDIETSTRVLESLRYIGVKVALDDFGTGYSSLSYLQRMPVDTVKIDRSFIRNVTSDWNSAAITSGIITLSHILSLKVVAEGVETDEQIQLLMDQSCNEVQGAYYSMPLSAEEAEVWM
jgi:predicted signal transduction protein with EAL and GGDEF domain